MPTPHAVDIAVIISSLIASLCLTFAKPFSDIFLFVKSSCALVSGNTNKSLLPKEWPIEWPSERIRAHSLNSYFAFCKIVINKCVWNLTISNFKGQMFMFIGFCVVWEPQSVVGWLLLKHSSLWFKAVFWADFERESFHVYRLELLETNIMSNCKFWDSNCLVEEQNCGTLNLDKIQKKQLNWQRYECHHFGHRSFLCWRIFWRYSSAETAIIVSSM